MTQDPDGYVFVDRLVRQPVRRTRRHITVADADWRVTGVQQQGYVGGSLSTTITINGIAFELRVDAVGHEVASDLLICGRRYRVVGLERATR